MKKLKKEDIRILHAGEQMHRAVLEKYNSIEEFSNETDMKINSLNVYFHCKPYGSKNFRLRLSNMLNRNIEDIIIDDRQQINNYINCIWQNKEAYKQDEDIEVFDCLKQICQSYGYDIELSKALRLVSIYYYFTNRLPLSIEYINSAIEIAKNIRNYDLLLGYNIDLAMYHASNGEISKAKHVYKGLENDISSQLEGISNRNLFHYYYRFGVINNSNYKFARQLFEKALIYATSEIEMGGTLSNIGLTYHEEKKYDLALKYYNESLEKYNQNDKLRRSYSYNNMANTYRELGDKKEAKKNIYLALELLGDNDTETYYIYIRTLIQIDYENLEELYNKMLSHFYSSRKYLQNKNTEIKAIDAIIEIAVQYNNNEWISSLIDEVESIILEYDREENKNIEHINRLKIRLADMFMHKRKMEGGTKK